MATGNFTLTDNALHRIFENDLNLEGSFHAILLDEEATAPDETAVDIEDVSPSSERLAEESNEVHGYEDEDLTSVAILTDTGAPGFDSATVAFDTAESSEIEAKWLIIVEGTSGAEATTDDLLGFMDLNTDSAEATVASVAGAFTVEPGAEGWFDCTQTS